MRTALAFRLLLGVLSIDILRLFRWHSSHFTWVRWCVCRVYWVVKAFTAPESVRRGKRIPFMDSFEFPPLLLLFLSRNASSNTIKIDNHEALWVHFENLLAAVQKTRIIPFGAARKQSRANMFVSEWIKVTGLWNLCRSMAFGREVVQKFMWILFSCCLTQAILAYRFSGCVGLFLDSTLKNFSICMYIRRLSVNYVTDAREPLSGYLRCSLRTASNYTILRIVCVYSSIGKSFSSIIKLSLKWN